MKIKFDFQGQSRHFTNQTNVPFMVKCLRCTTYENFSRCDFFMINVELVTLTADRKGEIICRHSIFQPHAMTRFE